MKRLADRDVSVDSQQHGDPDTERFRHVSNGLQVLDDVRHGVMPPPLLWEGIRQQAGVDHQSEEPYDQNAAVSHCHRLQEERGHLLLEFIVLETDKKEDVADQPYQTDNTRQYGVEGELEGDTVGHVHCYRCHGVTGGGGGIVKRGRRRIEAIVGKSDREAECTLGTVERQCLSLYPGG